MGSFCSLILPEPNLFLGGVSTFPCLNAYKIEASLSLGSSRPDPEKYPDIDVLHFVIDDHPDQKIGDLLEAGIEFIFKKRLAGKVVFVHCQAGVSRSTSFLIAYFMVIFNWTWYDTLDYIRNTCRSVVNPNEGFIKELKIFEKGPRDEIRQKLIDEYGDKLSEMAQRDLASVVEMKKGYERLCSTHYHNIQSTIGIHSSQTVGILLEVAKGKFLDSEGFFKPTQERLDSFGIWHGEYLDNEKKFEEIEGLIKGAPFVLIERPKNPLDQEKFQKDHGYHFGPEEESATEVEGVVPPSIVIEEEVEAR